MFVSAHSLYNPLLQLFSLYKTSLFITQLLTSHKVICCRISVLQDVIYCRHMIIPNCFRFLPSSIYLSHCKRISCSFDMNVLGLLCVVTFDWFTLFLSTSVCVYFGGPFLRLCFAFAAGTVSFSWLSFVCVVSVSATFRSGLSTWLFRSLLRM